MGRVAPHWDDLRGLVVSAGRQVMIRPDYRYLKACKQRFLITLFIIPCRMPLALLPRLARAPPLISQLIINYILHLLGLHIGPALYT